MRKIMQFLGSLILWCGIINLYCTNVDADLHYVSSYDIYTNGIVDLNVDNWLEDCSNVSHDVIGTEVIELISDYKVVGLKPGEAKVYLYYYLDGTKVVDEYIFTVKLSSGVYRINQYGTDKYLSAGSYFLLGYVDLEYSEYCSTGQNMLNQLWKIDENDDGTYKIKPYYNKDAIIRYNNEKILLSESKESYLDNYEDTILAKWKIDENCSIMLCEKDYHNIYLNESTILGDELIVETLNNKWVFELVSNPPTGIFFADIKNETVGTVEKRYISKGAEKSLRDLRIQALCYSGENYNVGLTWASSNPNIATVDAITGTVTGVKKGVTTVSCSVNINDTVYSKNYQVVVLPIADGLYSFNNYQTGFGIKHYEPSLIKATNSSSENLTWYFHSNLDGYYSISVANTRETEYCTEGDWFLGVTNSNAEGLASILSKTNMPNDNWLWKIESNVNVPGVYNIYPKNTLNNGFLLGMGALEQAYLELYVEDEEEYEYMWNLSENIISSGPHINVYTYYDQEFLNQFDSYQDMENYINTCYESVGAVFDRELNLTMNHISVEEHIRDEDIELNESNSNKGLSDDYIILFWDFYNSVIEGVDIKQEQKNARVLFSGYNSLSSTGGNTAGQSAMWGSACIINNNTKENSHAYDLLHEISHIIGAPDHYHGEGTDGTCPAGASCSICGTGEARRDCGCAMFFDSYNPNEPYCDDCKKDILVHLYNHHIAN